MFADIIFCIYVQLCNTSIDSGNWKYHHRWNIAIKGLHSRCFQVKQKGTTESIKQGTPFEFKVRPKISVSACRRKNGGTNEIVYTKIRKKTTPKRFNRKFNGAHIYAATRIQFFRMKSIDVFSIINPGDRSCIRLNSISKPFVSFKLNLNKSIFLLTIRLIFKTKNYLK